MQLHRTIGLKYIYEVLGLDYKIKKHDDKAKYKCKVKDGSCKKIRRYPIISLEKYNI